MCWLQPLSLHHLRDALSVALFIEAEDRVAFIGGDGGGGAPAAAVAALELRVRACATASPSVATVLTTTTPGGSLMAPMARQAVAAREAVAAGEAAGGEAEDRCAALRSLHVWARLVGPELAVADVTLIRGGDDHGGGRGAAGGMCGVGWSLRFAAPLLAGEYELEVVNAWRGGTAEPADGSALDERAGELWAPLTSSDTTARRRATAAAPSNRTQRRRATTADRDRIDWRHDGHAYGSTQVTCAERCFQRPACRFWHIDHDTVAVREQTDRCALFAAVAGRVAAANGKSRSGIRPPEREHMFLGESLSSRVAPLISLSLTHACCFALSHLCVSVHPTRYTRCIFLLHAARCLVRLTAALYASPQTCAGRGR